MKKILWLLLLNFQIHNRSSAKGLLLLDLLLTLLLIGILISIGFRHYMKEVNRARELEAIITLRNINQQQIIHFLEENTFTNNVNIDRENEGNYRFSVESIQANIAQAIATPVYSQLHKFTSVICYDQQQLWVKTYKGSTNQVLTIADQDCAATPTHQDTLEPQDPAGTSPENQTNVEPEQPSELSVAVITSEDQPQLGSGDTSQEEDTNIVIDIICQADPSEPIVDEQTTKRPPGLADKNAQGLEGKTIYGWEIAPGLSRITVKDQCSKTTKKSNNQKKQS